MTYPGPGQNPPPPMGYPPVGYPAPTLAHHAPPAGPGVQPPFAAPPTQRPRTRLWIGIAVSLVLTLLACGGGIVTLVTTTSAAPKQIEGKAKELVGEFLTDLRADRFDDAHKLLCTNLSKDVSIEDLRSEYDDLTAFEVRTAQFNNGDPILVTAAEDVGSGSEAVTYQVRIEETALRVCGRG